MTDRRTFLKKAGIAAATAVAAPIVANAMGMAPKNGKDLRLKADESINSRLIVPHGNALPITGTFLDEISHDIPHQNWGEKEWDLDFRYMKAMGIDTVIDIRCGYRKFITYPSPYLLKKGCYMPSTDMIEMFCRLAQKYGMKFWLGLYDSGKYWDTGDMSYEVEANKYVIDEIWQRYGSKYDSFGGWYISGEISRATKGAIESFRTMGRQCKEVSGGLPTFISPWIDGKKAVDAAGGNLTKEQAVSIEQHEGNGTRSSTGSMNMSTHAPSRTDTSTTTSLTRSSLSTRSWRTSTVCSAGPTPRVSTGTCRSVSSRSSSTN